MRSKNTIFGESRLFAALLLVALLVPFPAAAQRARGPVAVLPQDSAGGTDDFFYVDSNNGSLTHVDRLRRDPLEIRSRRLRQNLFQEIGRPTDQPASLGEILLGPIRTSDLNARAALFVETSTGYVAYFDQLGKNDVLGRISTVIGRPFGAIASADGNYALLMRHNTNGRTEGAYLYHASSGRGLWLAGIVKLEIDVEATPVPGFPKLSGRVAAAELQFSELTTGYLLADSADGTLRFLSLDDNARLSVRDTTVKLFPTFDPQAASGTPNRFVAAPVRNSNETTTHVLFADAATGDLAILEGVDEDDGEPVLRKLAANLYSVLGIAAGSGPHSLTAIAGRDANGATNGVWLTDSATRAMAYVESPDAPDSTTVQRVRVGN